MKRSWKIRWPHLLRLFFWIVVFGVPSYLIVFNLSVVRGKSMVPSVTEGDRILVEPWSYLFAKPDRGDIVIFDYPLDPSRWYVKRVIGLPDDEIVLVNGCVIINGEILDEPYVTNPDYRCSLKLKVSPDCYFVMGDNRVASFDSRDFGVIPDELIVGKADLCLFPFSRLGLVR